MNKKVKYNLPNLTKNEVTEIFYLLLILQYPVWSITREIESQYFNIPNIEMSLDLTNLIVNVAETSYQAVGVLFSILTVLAIINTVYVTAHFLLLSKSLFIDFIITTFHYLSILFRVFRLKLRISLIRVELKILTFFDFKKINFERSNKIKNNIHLAIKEIKEVEMENIKNYQNIKNYILKYIASYVRVIKKVINLKLLDSKILFAFIVLFGLLVYYNTTDNYLRFYDTFMVILYTYSYLFYRAIGKANKESEFTPYNRIKKPKSSNDAYIFLIHIIFISIFILPISTYISISSKNVIILKDKKKVLVGKNMNNLFLDICSKKIYNKSTLNQVSYEATNITIRDLKKACHTVATRQGNHHKNLNDIK